ncbi:MAG TPA: TIGR00730 family Rossman fold protein, partial [bacterium]|nr:TIGR00730 family Rossman fold protein [bacterium]
ETLAQRGITVVYGGAGVGLMGTLADAALAAGGEVVGVLPHPLFGKEVAHRGLTRLHEVASMHERKMKMFELSDGFLALPGGWGTLEEIFEMLTWAQLGLHRKPCGFLNVKGYYDGLLAFLEQMVARRFVKEKYRDLVLTGDDPSVLLDAMAAFRAPSGTKWIRPGET